ncbi:hypothetical protein AB6A40_009950 [Gnathostoma spinigerum]|uniref:Uncharacterized protein n=1 Tax=Gnathostoma spinigerum TaxID=75299 RepID=A0ABD6ETR2_9BILA
MLRRNEKEISMTKYRALKIWMTLKLRGLEGMRQYIAKVNNMAARLRASMGRDGRLIVGKQILGLICFQYKGTSPTDTNEKTYRLGAYINWSGKMLVTHAAPNGTDFIRITITRDHITEQKIDDTWMILQHLITEWEG